MIKYLGIIVSLILTSFYFFSFEFTFLPGINTKMLMAGLGVIVLLFQLGKRRKPYVDSDVLNLFVMAVVVSITGLFSVTYNETLDYSYATYVISMLVWTSAAYFLIKVIEKQHGRVSIEIICNYLIIVCVLQCVISLFVEYIPLVKSFVNNYVGSISGMGSAARMDERGRLYGIGAALDIAGTRFACCLFMISYLSNMALHNGLHKRIIWYLFSFIIISIIGNMISRTTTIGLLCAIVYFGWMLLKHHNVVKQVRLLKYCICFISIFLPIIILFYYNDPIFHQNLRFAFEGFFSLVETGEWDVNSTNILKNMYRFPETFKTWIIGDGYFDNPRIDPYYIGYMWKGFYMGTDVGYLRFIYYFGFIGLAAFLFFLFQGTLFCIKRNRTHSALFIGIFIINLIVWFKVSTDLFLVFALFVAHNAVNRESVMLDIEK